MCPIDDPSIPSIGPLAKLRQGRVRAIPGQAVDALQKAFQQALEDARGQPGREQNAPPHEQIEDGGKVTETPVTEGQEPPEVYGPHGEPPRAPEIHRLDLEG